MHYALIAVLTAAAAGLLSTVMRRTKPKRETAKGGHISPEKWTAVFTVIVGLLMAAGGLAGTVWAIIATPGDSTIVWAPMLSATGLAIAGFMAPSLTAMHDIYWDRNGLNGPCTTFGPTLGRGRTTIGWDEVVGTGETMFQCRYVQTEDNRRIYWSYLYKGHGTFESEIAQRCRSLNDSQAHA